MKHKQVVALLGLVVALMAFLYSPVAAGGGLCRLYSYCIFNCPANQEEAEDKCVDEANSEVTEDCDLEDSSYACNETSCGFWFDDYLVCSWVEDINP